LFLLNFNGALYVVKYVFVVMFRIFIYFHRKEKLEMEIRLKLSTSALIAVFSLVAVGLVAGPALYITANQVHAKHSFLKVQ
jgi:amino acid transporter